MGRLVLSNCHVGVRIKPESLPSCSSERTRAKDSAVVEKGSISSTSIHSQRKKPLLPSGCSHLSPRKVIASSISQQRVVSVDSLRLCCRNNRLNWRLFWTLLVDWGCGWPRFFFPSFESFIPVSAELRQPRIDFMGKEEPFVSDF